MVFNSLHFAAFFVVVYTLYRLLPHRPQNWLLLFASYYFYAAWDWRFLGLLIGSTLVDYVCALAMSRPGSTRRRIWLLVSLTYNLGALGFFKYFNFFADSTAVLLNGIGFNADFVTLRVLLPIGISFYTFMTISYVVDVYRREITPTRDLLDFAVFVAYFPHLVAGPILRASKLIPQIDAPRTITGRQMTEGAWLILWGLFQKIFVADNLARVTEAVFGAGAASPTGLDVLLATYAFAFQIYGDFAGYSNIARGTSKMMGIDLNINFLYPYFVQTPRQFWRHWHISLSTWLRDYLYIPLGGNRGSEATTRRNLMITMALGGLWHGAAWNFVVWGIYQGVILVVYRWAETRAAAAGRRVSAAITPASVALGLVMFHVTCYGWLIFRARSFEQIGALTAALATNFAPGSQTASLAMPLLQYVPPMLAIHVIEAWKDDLTFVVDWPMPARYAVYAAILYLTVLFGDFGGSEFIYFQF